MEKVELNLHFGALADSLEEQLKTKGVTLKNIKKYDNCMKSITLLYLSGYLTDGEREKVYARFLKEFKRDIRENLIQIEEEK